MSQEILLHTNNLTKRYGQNTVVNKVALDLYKGEILGLIGENGSGKSTILSMIYGITDITSGKIFLNNKIYQPKNSIEANQNHIQMLVQEMGTISELTISENVFLGKEDQFRKYGRISQKLMFEETKKVLKLVGLEYLDPKLKINVLELETRKLIELARAIYNQPELLMIDETTTRLTHIGRQILFKHMRDLKKKQHTMLFVTHDLDELMSVSDRIIVLRDGEIVKEFLKPDFDESQIKHAMVGRKISGNFYRNDYHKHSFGKPVLSANHISNKVLKDVSLTLHEGEILGIGGLSQSGMHNIGEVLFGYQKANQGEVIVYNHKINTIKEAISLKVGYISKNRDLKSLILKARIKDNIALPSLKSIENKYFYIKNSFENEMAIDMIEKFNIKCDNPNQFTYELSGGNKQKVAFSKWIANKSRILILDSPTRGVDVGVKTTMYQMIYRFKKQGYAIIIISEELAELIGMGDRILIFKDGKINKEFIRDENLEEKDIIEYMI